MNATSGPWIISKLNEAEMYGNFLAVRDAKKVIAITGLIGADAQDEAIANTALIAFAPEMRDALIKIDRVFTQELGIFNGVLPLYIPNYLMPLYEMQKLVSEIVEEIAFIYTLAESIKE